MKLLMRHSIMAAVTMVALTGCSDDFEPDLAACKAKAMEVYRPAQVSEEQPAAYLRDCMSAEGVSHPPCYL
jgi:Prokaryotic membrane lipoprotein lipid attachment site